MRYLSTLLAIASITYAGVIPSSEPGSSGAVFKRYNSNNWCGPVTSGSNITSVESTWTVPTVSLPQGGSQSEQYQFYQWVGIDGTNNCGALVQGGTGQTIQNGQISYYTWYEFWPAPPVYGHVNVSPGDTVYVKVDVTSATTGTIYLENKTTGQSYTEYATSPGPSLCFATAEWIGEDPGNTPEPFPAFTEYDFTECLAHTSSGQTLNLSGAEDWIMYKDQTRLCHPQRKGDLATSIIYG